ncbi:unnamed protein product [Pleuronectes platessa]|uniref:Uncharacterized protein n=1 Tax=Pleuronectes platessa TaxID=8262 RepID=A0A9N7U6C6_PLEPL|nr:unnamed protein product [Pleuronectes platessa]
MQLDRGRAAISRSRTRPQPRGSSSHYWTTSAGRRSHGDAVMSERRDHEDSEDLWDGSGGVRSSQQGPAPPPSPSPTRATVGVIHPPPPGLVDQPPLINVTTQTSWETHTTLWDNASSSDSPCPNLPWRGPTGWVERSGEEEEEEGERNILLRRRRGGGSGGGGGAEFAVTTSPPPLLTSSLAPAPGPPFFLHVSQLITARAGDSSHAAAAAQTEEPLGIEPVTPAARAEVNRLVVAHNNMWIQSVDLRRSADIEKLGPTCSSSILRPVQEANGGRQCQTVSQTRGQQPAGRRAAAGQPCTGRTRTPSEGEQRLNGRR